ncbi:PCYCGC motif-containing (lipo)protein [Bacillus sp. FJAT-49736]|uniref:PCYCGC motif-containing (lipo)protein n=1 Tax=Bacillus sp. FJAT-49736 TaxID=2833582 RepID=UPI001BC9B48D|nr:PCYCGC motif-containing (lipo)protein [Bacillus sp. FJAT-49736]MBS4174731.1 hypothetical protein [Bacillus sp. FJAT-49736]
MVKRYLLSILIVFVLILAAGCSSTENSINVVKDNNHGSMGDMVEKTASVNELPKFLSGEDDTIKSIYQASASSRELLEKIPCFCGCGDSVGHKNNYDCFVHENKKNGEVVWDSHGVNCDVCLEIAAQSITDYHNGKSIKEIRNDIDQKYKEGYATPTPTPKI